MASQQTLKEPNKLTAKPTHISTASGARHMLWLEVVEFLKSLKLEEYIDTFKNEGYDRMGSIYDITGDDLKDMNIKRGHRKFLLTQINEHKQKNNPNPKKQVRFGYGSTSGGGSTISSLQSETTHIVENSSLHSTQLAIVDENKNQSPNVPHSNPNGIYHHLNSYNYSSSQQHHLVISNQGSNHINNNNNNNKMYHSQINPRKLKLPLQNNSTARSQSYSNGTMLVRSASASSDDSDIVYVNNGGMGTLSHQKSYHSNNGSQWSDDAGTVIIRGSVVGSPQPPGQIHQQYSSDVSDNKNIKNDNNIMSVNNFPLSPAMPPIQPDMHNDINSLIDNLMSASCVNNNNYDEYHEALVSVTTNWNRVLEEKRLKMMLSQSNNTNYVVMDLLGVLNAQLGNTDIAIKYHTQSISKSSNKYIESMHNYAYLLHRIGDIENDNESIKWYKKALSINNKFAHCWLHYGNLLEDQNKLKQASEMYLEAINIRPANAAFHLDLANVLDDLNEYDLASEHYLKCIDLQPNDPVYHWNHAISLENQCFYYKAEESYKRAINLDFNCIDARINYAHMLENQPTPQYKKALKQYEIILTIDNMRNNTEYMLKCAKLYDHFGENNRAENLYMKVIQMDPTYEDAYILFSSFLTNQNRIEDANACYQAGIRHTNKLQEQYIQFLKDINNIYNKKTKNMIGASSFHQNNNKPPNINTHSKSVSKANVPPSPFIQTYTASIHSKNSNNNNNNNNGQHTPSTPGTDYDMGFDYYRPASNKKQPRTSQKLNNTSTKDDQGCIVM